MHKHHKGLERLPSCCSEAGDKDEDGLVSVAESKVVHLCCFLGTGSAGEGKSAWSEIMGLE